VRIDEHVEYRCPECGHGCYSIRDNSDAPIPIHVPPSIHDDEGRPVSFCPWCDTELTVEALTLSPMARYIRDELMQ
jgi:hypothetical protein